MKIKLLLFFCLLVHAFSFGQGRIVPFEDYSKCNVGFQYLHGDTLFTAKFENLKEIHLENHSGQTWTLSENDAFGLLNSKGNWLIACKYQYLEKIDRKNLFMVRLNGKMGIVSSNDSIILPIEYDDIQLKDYNNGSPTNYIVGKDGLYGVLDSSYNLLIPLQYESIEKTYSFYNEQQIINEFYKVSSKGSIGLISKKNELIIPPIYKKIKLLHTNRSSHKNYLFEASDSLRQSTIYSQSGKQLVPLSNVAYELVYFPSFDKEPIINFVKAENKLGQTIFYNIATGKSSGWWEEISLLGNWIYVSQNEKWSIMDLNFKMLHQDLSDQLSYFDDGAFIESIHSGRPEDMYSYSEKYNGLPPVFLLQQEVENSRGKKKNAYDWPQYSNYALWNIETGQRTAFLYFKVFRIISPQGDFYWAFNEQELGVEEHEMTAEIFDETGTFLRQLCLPVNGYLEIERFARINQTFPHAFLPNESGKFGVISKNGILLHDFEFDEQPDNYADNNLIILKKNTLFGVYNSQLKEVISPVYSAIQRLESDLFLLWKGEVLSFADTNGIILIDSCDTYLSTARISSDPNQQNHSYFAIKNNTIYFFFGDRFVVFDSTFTKNDNQVGSLKVDRFGKIISNPTTVQRRKIDLLYYTLEGNDLRVENEKKELIRIIPSIKKYWAEDYAVFLTTTDGKTGIINIITAEWEIKPIYPQVSIYNRGDYHTFWANYGSAETIPETGWFLTNQQGELLTDILFDQPFTKNHSSAFRFFRSKEKWGVIDNDLKITVSPRFDSKTTVKDRSFLLKKDSVFLIDQQTGKAFHLNYTFDETKYVSCMLLFIDSAIAIIDLTGKFLLPFTKREEVEQTVNLSNYLFPFQSQRSKAPYIRNNYIYYFGDSIALRKMTNHLILEKAFKNRVPLNLVLDESYSERQTNNDFNELRANSLKSQTNQIQEIIEPLFVNYYCYSEKRRISANQPIYGGNYHFVSYQFSGNSAIELQLKDVFKPESGYDDTLTLLMEEIIQKKQLFGINCIDMPGIIQEFKRNFYFSNKGITFVHLPTRIEMYISTSDMEKLLVNPAWFELSTF